MTTSTNTTMDVYPAQPDDKRRVDNEDGTYSIIVPTTWARRFKDADGNEHTERAYIQQDHGTPEQLDQRRKAMGVSDSQWNATQSKNTITSIIREVR